jgi:hypothetical protein
MRALATPAAQRATAPPVVHEVLRSPGQPLEPRVRAEMEPRFGHDFSRVRVHADERAAESARSVAALAYTVGRDVVFDTGRYAPHTLEGRRLLAHELTHVVQQREVATPRDPLPVGDSADPAELAAADVSSAGGTAPLVQRQGSGASPWQTWLIGPTLTSGACQGWASPFPDQRLLFSDCGSPIKGCRRPDGSIDPVALTFEVDFWVDALNAPRPAPFKTPIVSFQMKFTPDGGSARTVREEKPSVAPYNGPGSSLQTSFSPSVPFETDRPGWVSVALNQADPSTGLVARYVDAIRVEAVKCPPPPPQPTKPGPRRPGGGERGPEEGGKEPVA